jgi:nucleoside-diphosphate-sugar epimerase
MLLITGATGFVGTNVVKTIRKVREDIRILAIDFENARKLYPDFEVIKGDVTRKDTLKGVEKDVDVVIHLAGIVSYSLPKREIFRINYEGTKNILEISKDTEKFIFSSSVSVYGEIKGKASESYPKNPKNPYGFSKLEAEQAILNSGIPYVIFRMAPIYGAGSPSWLKNLHLLEKGFPIPSTNNLTHILHISDASKAFELGLRKGIGIYNIADKEPIQFSKLAEIITKLLGKKPKFLPSWFVNLLARMKGMKTYLDVLTMNRNYDISKAREELGFAPNTDLEKELKKMVEWYKRTK